VLVRAETLKNGMSKSCGCLQKEIVSTRRLKDLRGQRFGRLIVLERGPNAVGQSKVQWYCQCDCGKQTLVMATNLQQKDVQSCGCLGQEVRGAHSRTHGKSRTREYIIWRNIKRRCLSPTDPTYKYYGGRGIALLWTSFEEFFADMGPRPGPTYSIERRDNNGPYSKDNCVWIPRGRQQYNKRTTRWVLYEGERMSLAEAAEKSGIPYYTLSYQVNHGRPSIVIPLPRDT
jgi:hypothetical protein